MVPVNALRTIQKQYLLGDRKKGYKLLINYLWSFCTVWYQFVSLLPDLTENLKRNIQTKHGAFLFAQTQLHLSKSLKNKNCSDRT